MTITPEIRAKYKEMKQKAEAIEAAADPQRKALAKALEPYYLLQEEMSELVDSDDPQDCTGCGESIFEGDRRAHSDEGPLCEACSPTYQDMLDNPENFVGSDDEPWTVEQVRKHVQDHVAGGGSLTDTTAF